MAGEGLSVSSRPPKITPSTITGTIDATHTGTGPTRTTPADVVPAEVGATFRAYTTAIGKTVPYEVNRARAAVAGFRKVVR